MGKKRTREADGQGDVAMDDPAVDRTDEDDSSDDEVSRRTFIRFNISMATFSNIGISPA